MRLPWAILLSAAACSTTAVPGPVASPVVCTMEARSGLAVTVRSADGAKVCDAQVTATDGTYSENLEPFGAGATTIVMDRFRCVYSGLEERPGDYRIAVIAPGFLPAQIEHLVIGRGVCHVIARAVTVALTPK